MGMYMSCMSVKNYPDAGSSGKNKCARKKDEKPHFQYENGRRFHNEDCPYPMPNDLEEIDRLDIQHYAIQLTTGKRHFAPMEDSKRALDIGTGSGTWMMEMAADFPECHFLGVDIAPLQPTTVLPQNCSFELTNVLKGIPKPDGWFDYIHQRMLIGAIPKDAWEDHIKECARVCASGGWIELLEVNALLLGGGPAAEQFNRWATGGFAAVGINPTLAGELDVFLKKAGFINIRKMYYKLPCGPWGGKAGLLFARDFKLLNSSLKPLFTRAFNISDEVVDANTEEIMKEIEVHKAYADFYVYVGQKP